MFVGGISAGFDLFTNFDLFTADIELMTTCGMRMDGKGIWNVVGYVESLNKS